MHTNPGGRPRISLGRVGGAVDARTHGMRLGGGRQYAKRYRTAQGRAGAGQQGEDGDSGSGAAVVTLVMVTKRLRSASLTISLSCSHLRPKQ